MGDALPKATGQVRCGAEPVYEPVREVVERIWQASEQLCGKRLEPALELWLPHYGKHFGGLLPTQKKLLKKSQRRDFGSDVRIDQRRGAPTPVRHATGHAPAQIPIQGEVWDEQRAGFLEADSVAHCGSSLAGDFIWSLTYTCLGSGWTEGRAVWNKGAVGVVEQTKNVERSLPFALLGMDFDNGSEWLNWHLMRYLQERTAPVKLTARVPITKTITRTWNKRTGCGRGINRHYKETWGPLHNFFLPSAKLVEKHREGSKWVRRHDRPQTAYQRLLAGGQWESKQVRRLREWHHALDPFALARQTEKPLGPILR